MRVILRKKIKSKDTQFDLPLSLTACIHRKRGKGVMLLLEKMIYQKDKWWFKNPCASSSDSWHQSMQWNWQGQLRVEMNPVPLWPNQLWFSQTASLLNFKEIQLSIFSSFLSTYCCCVYYQDKEQKQLVAPEAYFLLNYTLLIAHRQGMHPLAPLL